MTHDEDIDMLRVIYEAVQRKRGVEPMQADVVQCQSGAAWNEGPFPTQARNRESDDSTVGNSTSYAHAPWRVRTGYILA